MEDEEEERVRDRRRTCRPKNFDWLRLGCGPCRVGVISLSLGGYGVYGVNLRLEITPDPVIHSIPFIICSHLCIMPPRRSPRMSKNTMGASKKKKKPDEFGDEE
ncbi:hypothetical protein F2Q70_00017144 [Brassica cretica]|uniref:Uncharacterized protein n=1 Tax=Brassica cretica TaxID=69181 RepID=A0A8S9HX39_BRACR|nr:hypothetical protein F2Q70_00017144 [Brassica cretica]